MKIVYCRLINALKCWCVDRIENRELEGKNISGNFREFFLFKQYKIKDILWKN